MKQGLSEKQFESIRRIKSLIEECCEGKQSVFAEKTGIGKASISHYVNASHAPGQDHAMLISLAFGVDPMWVMGFPVPKKRIPQEIEDSADVSNRLRSDPDMVKALKEYFKMPPDMRRRVVEMIHLLADK